MKTSLIILSLIVGSSAQAAYKVGNAAVYAATGEGQKFDVKNEIVALDEAKDSIKIKQTVIISGVAVQEEEQEGSLSGAAQNELVFDVCFQLPKELNPRIESLTVPAGTFSTCHITEVDATGTNDIYFGKVLFGLVKVARTKTTDNSDMSMELKSVNQ